MTLALLYLLGRMPEQDEEAFEIHLLECPGCLARVQAVEQALQFHRCLHGETLSMKDLRRRLFPLVVLFLGLASVSPAAGQFGGPPVTGPETARPQ